MYQVCCVTLIVLMSIMTVAVSDSGAKSSDYNPSHPSNCLPFSYWASLRRHRSIPGSSLSGNTLLCLSASHSASPEHLRELWATYHFWSFACYLVSFLQPLWTSASNCSLLSCTLGNTACSISWVSAAVQEALLLVLDTVRHYRMNLASKELELVKISAWLSGWSNSWPLVLRCFQMPSIVQHLPFVVGCGVLGTKYPGLKVTSPATTKSEAVRFPAPKSGKIACW